MISGASNGSRRIRLTQFFEMFFPYLTNRGVNPLIKHPLPSPRPHERLTNAPSGCGLDVDTIALL